MSVDMKVYCRPWRESEQTEPEDAVAMLIDHITLNGHTLHTVSPAEREIIELLEGETGELEAETPAISLDLDSFAVLTVRQMTDQCWSHLTAEDWVEGSTQDECYIIVRSVEIVFLPIEDWVEAEI